MEKSTNHNLKLGAFVIAGLLFLVLLLYMIGRNRNLFGSNFILKAHFRHVQGLVAGNNVRYNGIEAGTIKKVMILNDTLIEVTMLVDSKLEGIVRKNTLASIGTDGLVGNKVLNLSPGKETAAAAIEGDILPSRHSVNTEDMLQTLNKTNEDVATIAAALKITISRINESSGIWSLLQNDSIPRDIQLTVRNIRKSSEEARATVDDLHRILEDVRAGKGSVGMLLTDTAFAQSLHSAARKLDAASLQADSLSQGLHTLVDAVGRDYNQGRGPLPALLKDSLMTERIEKSLEHIQKGTDGFNQNMEALKQNFLFRGYFKKQAKKQAQP